MEPRYWKALDAIFDTCKHHASPEFWKYADGSLKECHTPLPDDQGMMRHLCEAIAFSQGARSSMVTLLIKEPVFEQAFKGFDPDKLAEASPENIRGQYWGQLKRMRYKKKVDAIIGCAGVLRGIARENGSFAEYLRAYGIPPRLKSPVDIDLFWRTFDAVLGDLQRRRMPFFRSTTSLLQLLLGLDYDSVKPDLIVMRLARRIGMVRKETGDRHLREAVRKLQEYALARGIRVSATDWHLLAYGGQTEAGPTLTEKFCLGPGSCSSIKCPLGTGGLCLDFQSAKRGARSKLAVYLAGPIFQCEDHECVDWRETAKRTLVGVKILDPMDRDCRGKTEENFRQIVEQDKADIDRCDILLVNCHKPSSGTAMEMLYAWERKKRVYVVADDDVVSPWIRYHSTQILRTLADATALINQQHKNGKR